MSPKLTKEIREYLKREYEGDKKFNRIRVLNLIREFKFQKMRGFEIKEYPDRLLGIAIKIRLLEYEFS